MKGKISIALNASAGRGHPPLRGGAPALGAVMVKKERPWTPKTLNLKRTLADSELLLKNTARSMDDDAEYTLESILAEYGERRVFRRGPGPEEPKGADEPPAAAQAAENSRQRSAAHRTVIPGRGGEKDRWMKRRTRPPACPGRARGHRREAGRSAGRHARSGDGAARKTSPSGRRAQAPHPAGRSGSDRAGGARRARGARSSSRKSRRAAASSRAAKCATPSSSTTTRRRMRTRTTRRTRMPDPRPPRAARGPRRSPTCRAQLSARDQGAPWASAFSRRSLCVIALLAEHFSHPARRCTPQTRCSARCRCLARRVAIVCAILGWRIFARRVPHGAQAGQGHIAAF